MYTTSYRSPIHINSYIDSTTFLTITDHHAFLQNLVYCICVEMPLLEIGSGKIDLMWPLFKINMMQVALRKVHMD